MGLFGGKKKDTNFKALTEKEIQTKLYGVFQSADEPEDRQEPESKTSVGLKEKTSPAAPSNDLFKVAPPSPKDDLPVPSNTKPPETEPTNGGHEKVEVAAEGKGVRIRPAAWNKALSRPVSLEQRQVLVLRNLFRGLFRSLAEIVQKTFGKILDILFSLDFQKREVRVGFSVLLGLFFLILLFVGIDRLNVKRETAMKAFRKMVPAAAFKSSAKASSSHAAPSPKATPNLPAEAAEKKSVEKEPQAQIPQAAEAEGHKPYAVQLVTYASENDARRLLGLLEKEKIEAFIKPLQRGNGKIYYCVFIGRYRDYETAERQLSEFKKKQVAKPFQDAFVRSL